MEEKKKRGYTAAQGKATQKWEAANYYRLSVRFPIADKEKIQKIASDNNMSVAAYITQAVYEKMEK